MKTITRFIKRNYRRRDGFGFKLFIASDPIVSVRRTRKLCCCYKRSIQLGVRSSPCSSSQSTTNWQPAGLDIEDMKSQNLRRRWLTKISQLGTRSSTMVSSSISVLDPRRRRGLKIFPRPRPGFGFDKQQRFVGNPHANWLREMSLEFVCVVAGRHGMRSRSEANDPRLIMQIAPGGLVIVCSMSPTSNREGIDWSCI